MFLNSSDSDIYCKFDLQVSEAQMQISSINQLELYAGNCEKDFVLQEILKKFMWVSFPDILGKNSKE